MLDIMSTACEAIERINESRSMMIVTQSMADKITPKELQARTDEYVIIDVREADELEEGKIDAVNIPLGQIIRKARQGDLNDLKRRKICTYCSGGYRGNMAADELNKQGFDSAVTIEGDIPPGKTRKRKMMMVVIINSNE
jgi:rhodanese-related sulfurtransferase